MNLGCWKKASLFLMTRYSIRSSSSLMNSISWLKNESRNSDLKITINKGSLRRALNQLVAMGLMMRRRYCRKRNHYILTNLGVRMRYLIHEEVTSSSWGLSVSWKRDGHQIRELLALIPPHSRQNLQSTTNSALTFMQLSLRDAAAATTLIDEYAARKKSKLDLLNQVV